MTRSRIGVLALGLAAALGGCQPADQSASAAEAIRAADSAWAQTFANKDMDAFVGYVAADGVTLPPNDTIVTGPDGVRPMMEQFFALPNLTGTWHVTKAEAARSGELGYSMGTYEFHFNDPDGNPVTDRGKYATVWRQQADGSWKAIVDVFNSDMPPAGSDSM